MSGIRLLQYRLACLLFGRICATVCIRHRSRARAPVHLAASRVKALAQPAVRLAQAAQANPTVQVKALAVSRRAVSRRAVRAAKVRLAVSPNRAVLVRQV